jgi:outer membrane protein assembly factor BamB
LLASCGGGGGSSATPQSEATLSVSPTSISVTVSALAAAPTASLNAAITSTAKTQTTYYLDGKFTSNGISAITDPDSNGDLQIQFKDPSTLGVGVYNDTITLEGCIDQACTEQINNSPLVVPVTYTVTVAVPQITAISPAYGLVGEQNLVLLISGENFSSTAVVQWAGSPLTTTVQSTSSLQAVVPNGDLAATGTPAITVADGALVSTAVPFTIYQVAPPSVSGMSPGTAYVNSPAFTLSVTGSNFLPQSIVQWAGAALATTYVSQSQLTAIVPASDLMALGGYAVTVSTDGEVSTSSAEFTVQPVQTPTITQLSPSSTPAGGAAFVLTVNGANFNSQSVVNWGGSPRTTSYMSSGQLTAQINAADLASAGTVPITVQTQSVVSLATNFTVVPLPPLVLGNVTPATVTAGGAGFMLTVNGAGFASSAVVQWNGSARATTYVSGIQLSAQIFASDIAAVGSGTVTVQNPANLGGSSNGVRVTISKPSIDAVALQINPSHTGAVTFQNLALPAQSLWSVNVGGQASYALIADGNVYVTVTPTNSNGLSELLALSQTTGAVVWGPVELTGAASATYDNGMVFVLSNETGSPGLLQAFNGSTGALQWSTSLTEQYEYASGVTALNGLVYTNGAGIGATQYGVVESDGTVAWTQQMPAGSGATPAVTVDGVYVDVPCHTYDFNPANGATIWYNNTGCDGGGGVTSIVANSVFYAGSTFGPGISGQTLNAETGTVISSFVADNPPALGSTTGYFLQSGTLRGLQLSNNTVLWSFAGDAQLQSSPLLVNNYVFIGSASGNLYALNATTGSVVWQMNLGAEIPAGSGGPVPLYGLSAGDGLLVVPAGNTVSAYELSTDP